MPPAIVTEAIARIGFSAWLRAQLNGPRGDAEGDGDSEPTQDPRERMAAGVRTEVPPSLEELLRRLSRDPNLLTELDRTFRQVTQNLRRARSALPAHDRQLLEDFRSVWRVIHDGFRAPT
jgi:hypothetical protein